MAMLLSLVESKMYALLRSLVVRKPDNTVFAE